MWQKHFLSVFLQSKPSHQEYNSHSSTESCLSIFLAESSSNKPRLPIVLTRRSVLEVRARLLFERLPRERPSSRHSPTDARDLHIYIRRVFSILFSSQSHQSVVSSVELILSSGVIEKPLRLLILCADKREQNPWGRQRRWEFESQGTIDDVLYLVYCWILSIQFSRSGWVEWTAWNAYVTGMD